MWFGLAFSFSWSFPTTITSVKMVRINNVTTPNAFPRILPGTRPMIIIMKMTIHSSMAVERFSTMMSGMMKALTMRMYLKAFLSAPCSVCMALSICAVASTNTPLAISEG